MEQDIGFAEVQQTHERMRETFSLEREKGQCLRVWLAEARPLVIDAAFSLFGQRADQTDLDNLLKELFTQMLLALFPEMPSHERSRKDHSFFEVHIRKIRVLERMVERSVITIRPLYGS